MTITVEEFTHIVDAVGDAANTRKQAIRDAYPGDQADLSVKWYRSRKNSDIKDALTLEGIKRGFSVRAEKVMGALPEYCEKSDQHVYNRFDLSWEETKESRNFSLLVEIEMDLNVGSVVGDFRKLINNKSDCLKAMVCQAKNELEINSIIAGLESALSEAPSRTGVYVLSIWAWQRSEFVHYRL